MLRLGSRPLIVLWLLSRVVLSAASESATRDGRLLAASQSVASQSVAGQAGVGKSTAAAKAKPSDATVDYLRDIRPILSDACYACHGPDQASRQADLRLDQWEATFGRESPTPQIIVPGDSENSVLIERITSGDSEEVMPPPATGKSLSPKQIVLIRRWIDQGATWKKHWAFVTPRRPLLPTVSDPGWSADNPIDAFVLAKLDQQRWKPALEAEKEILIRRVTFDLTGLPPTLAEVDAFLEDGAPDAYQRVVDRLLHSPHYGEHMARYWLDAARYGDTHGLHLDNYREMWPYRDWVVQAFNNNLPYDQFVIEQLSGDLLESATLDQRVATGFCRAHVTTNEGGSIEQEVFTRNVVDRVSTMGTVFLGLTLGCAVCHDHKFDPITQREFYQLFAYFNSLDGPALDGNVKDPAPVVHVPSPSQSRSLGELRRQIAEIRNRRAACQADADPNYAPWLHGRVEQARSTGIDKELHISDGLVVHCRFDGPVGDQQMINEAAHGPPGQLVGAVRRVEGRLGAGLEFGAGGHVDLGDVASFGDDMPFSYGAWVKTSHSRKGIVLAKTDAALLHRGYELSLLDGRVTTQLSRRQPGYVIKVMTQEAVIAKHAWHHVFVTYDGSHRASGIEIYVDGQRQAVNVWSDALQFKRKIGNDKPLLIGNRDQGIGFEGGRIDDVRLYKKCLTDAEVQAVFLESQFDFLKSKPRRTWTDQEWQALHHFFLVRHDSVFWECTQELEQHLMRLRHEELAVPTTLVYRELQKPRHAHVLIRGEYDQLGESVDRRTPASLPPMPADFPRNRLGLARWLVSAENPLVSRVAVNRLWQQVFGTGLVATSEDFGSQGAIPSHPELLDWLAVEFRTSGWDTRAMMRLLVTSAAYRQSSATNAKLTRADPDNRLLARGPRYRLDAEMLRDQALAVSGLLVSKLGGPSIKPPQPAGLWRAVGFSSSNTVEYVADTDPEKIHRRSLYGFLKRTAPPPEMNTFDAPSRESSCVRRERTNTPLQSLLLLNDPQYVEAALALATRVLRADLETTGQRAVRMFRLCTARRPTDGTIQELVGLYEDQLARYERDEAAAQELLATFSSSSAAADLDASQRAAWTIVANLILNLDEVLTKN